MLPREATVHLDRQEIAIPFQGRPEPLRAGREAAERRLAECQKGLLGLADVGSSRQQSGNA